MIQLSLSETQNLAKSLGNSLWNQPCWNSRFYFWELLYKILDFCSCSKGFPVLIWGQMSGSPPSFAPAHANLLGGHQVCPGCPTPQGMQGEKLFLINHLISATGTKGKIWKATKGRTGRDVKITITTLNVHIYTKILLHADTGRVIFPGIHI